METRSVFKRYIVVSVIAIIALSVISIALEVFAGFSVGSGVSIVAVLVPALDAGQTHAMKMKAMPEKRYMWRMAAWFAAINMSLSLILTGVVLLVSGQFEALLKDIAIIGPVGWGLIFTVVFIICWSASRFFFGFGAKNGLKVQEKLAAKKQP